MGRIISTGDIRKGDVIEVTERLTVLDPGFDGRSIRYAEYPFALFRLDENAKITLIERGITLPTEAGSRIKLYTPRDEGIWFLYYEFGRPVWVSRKGTKKSAVEMQAKCQRWDDMGYGHGWDVLL